MYVVAMGVNRYITLISELLTSVFRPGREKEKHEVAGCQCCDAKQKLTSLQGYLGLPADIRPKSGLPRGASRARDSLGTPANRNVSQLPIKQLKSCNMRQGFQLTPCSVLTLQVHVACALQTRTCI